MEVVDVDLKASGSGFAGFERARRAGWVPGWLRLVRTPSGGMHAYFPADPSRPQPSWQAARVHVDFRGAGGYVVVPPSAVTLGDGRVGRYVVACGRQPNPSPVDAAALRDFLDPRLEHAYRPGGMGRTADAERLAGWVAALAEGERNRGLFWAACRLAEGGLAPAAALDALGPAAEQAGLPPREVATTIRSAYRATTATPVRTVGGAPEQGGVPTRVAQPARRVLS